MTNRFKFRLFDKGYKIMTDNPINSINLAGQILLNDGKYHDINQSDYVLMQSTGTSDLTGKEIFEGDIVERSWGKRLIICWDHANAAWVGIPYDENPCEEEYKDYKNPYEVWKTGYNCVEFDSFCDTKIIGNIYENPELLDDN